MEPKGNLVKYLIQGYRDKLSGIYPDQEIRQFVYLLFEDYLGWSKTRIHLSYDAEIPGHFVILFDRALEELYAGNPVQYILGKCWFNGTLLKVDARVLIPRPETEELCAMIKADHSGVTSHKLAILDIGTGSGCIAIDLKKYFHQSEVTAVDISREALEVAGENALTNHCEISFIRADILEQQDWGAQKKYSIVVSNPPYVTESEKKLMHRNVTEFEPSRSLFVADGDPLLFYKAISRFAAAHLVLNGRLYFEINELFGMEVSDLVRSYGFEDVRVVHDFNGKTRFISAVLKIPVLP